MFTYQHKGANQTCQLSLSETTAIAHSLNNDKLHNNNRKGPTFIIVKSMQLPHPKIRLQSGKEKSERIAPVSTSFIIASNKHYQTNK